MRPSSPTHATRSPDVCPRCGGTLEHDTRYLGGHGYVSLRLCEHAPEPCDYWDRGTVEKPPVMGRRPDRQSTMPRTG